MHQEEGQSPGGGGMLRTFSVGLTWVQREKKAQGKGRGEVTTWTGCYKEQLQATSIKNPQTNRKNTVDDYLKPMKISISNKYHGKKRDACLWFNTCLHVCVHVWKRAHCAANPRVHMVKL